MGGDTNQFPLGHFESEVAGKHLRSGVRQEVGYINCPVLELRSSHASEHIYEAMGLDF